MSTLAKRMREAKIAGHRTGQTPGMFAAPVRPGNGGCAPTPPTQPQSWGAACPPGFCTGDQLAQNLNRSFAGERYGCRELPYTVTGTADAQGDLTISQNSTVTMCPTRVMVMGDDGVVIPADASLTVFEIGNQNQILGDPIPVSHLSPFSYQIIPFVTDCIKAGIPFTITISGWGADEVAYVTLIGPAIG